ncbi:hypothetical protein [Luteolibacter pohnpeiensis]|nr:hypothetical protein [Luteolibacter pohnpeiensis]
MHLILTLGFRLKTSDPNYVRIQELWTKQREEKAQKQAEDYNRTKISPEERAALKLFRAAIKGRTSEEIEKITKAIERAVSKIESL